MDITLAKQLLTSSITANTNDATALNLALSILENTFNADFTALETSKAEADKATSDLSVANTTIANLNGQVSDLTTKVTTLTGQLTDAQTALATEQAAHQTDNTANEATINDLKAQILALTPVENPLQAPQS